MIPDKDIIGNFDQKEINFKIEGTKKVSGNLLHCNVL